jgi:riboflavin kinase / FMN adenylyltransferase
MQIDRLNSLAPQGWPLPVVTIGNFDGVHRGHQALVEVSRERALALGGTVVVLTFDPHPARVLSPDRAPSSLTTIAQKAEILGGLGVDRLAILPFTAELAGRTAADFASLVLRGALGARVVVVGEPFRFGRGREGDVTALEALGRALGFEVIAVAPVLVGQTPVSSSRIRSALEIGDVEGAEQLLGRAFFVDGEVIRGAARGRTLGFPTANVASENETLPATGVYVCWSQEEGTGARIPAVANVGRRPTFGGGALGLEVHLLDWSGDLYGRRLRVGFTARLRAEQAFPSRDALVAQIESDVRAARRILEKA